MKTAYASAVPASGDSDQGAPLYLPLSSQVVLAEEQRMVALRQREETAVALSVAAGKALTAAKAAGGWRHTYKAAPLKHLAHALF